MIGYAFARFKITITVFTTGDRISLGSSGGFCLLPHPAGNGGGLDPRLFEWNSAKRCRGGYSVETCGQSGETDKKISWTHILYPIQSYSVCFNCTWAYYVQVRSVTNSSGVLGITASLQQKESKRRRSCPGFADAIQQRSGTRALAHSGLGGQNASADRWIASWIGWKQGGLAKKDPGFSSEISDSWSSWCIWRSYLCEHPDGCCVVNWEDDGVHMCIHS